MTEILEKVRSFLEPLLSGSDIFIINIKIKPVNNIKVYLDADSGFSIDKAATINKKLYSLMEGSGLFPQGDFSLEVSSPGVDEPLSQLRQYKKNIGRKISVTDVEGTERTGVLKEASDEQIIIEMLLQGGKEKKILEIPFTIIKKSVVQINFN